MVDKPKIVSSWRPWSFGFTLTTEVSGSMASSDSALARIRAELTSAGAHRVLDTGPTSFRFKRKFPGWSMSALTFVDKGEVRAELLGARTIVSVKTDFLPWVFGSILFTGLCTIQGLPIGLTAAMVALVDVTNGVYAYRAIRGLLARSIQPGAARAA
jgi:hypothetical protein